MDKSKLIAVALLVCIGGALLYTKSQDPAAPRGEEDESPQPTAIAAASPDESADAIQNAATAEVTGNAASTDNAAPAPGETAPTEDKPEADATELKIIDLREGTGPVAQTGDSLSMNYKGMLTNGKVFDQSYGKAPFDFDLGAKQVIAGWDKGIVGMKVGGKRKLIIPSEMGYGASGAGADIPPNATLVFEVELLSVNGKTS